MEENIVNAGDNNNLLLCLKCKLNIPKIRSISIDTMNQIYVSLECHCSSPPVHTLLLSSYLFALPQANQPFQCVNHSLKTGVSYCSLCTKTYCNHCAQNHTTISPTHLLNQKGIFIEKCPIPSHIKHGIQYRCTTCPSSLCLDCKRGHDIKHTITSIKDLRAKQSSVRPLLPPEVLYQNSINEEINRSEVLIQNIQKIINDLLSIQTELKEYINSLSINDPLIELASVIDNTYYARNAEYNMNSNHNRNSLKLQPMLHYIENSKAINATLNEIAKRVLRIKDKNKFNACCLFEIKQFIGDGLFTMNIAQKPTLTYSSKDFENSLICVKADNIHKYFKLKRDSFLGVKDYNYVFIEDAVFNSKQKAKQSVNAVIRRAEELSNGDIMLQLDQTIIIFINKTLEQIEMPKQSESIEKAVEVKEKVIAVLSKFNNIILWYYRDRNTYRQAHRDENANGYDMVLFDQKRLAFCSGGSIKLLDLENFVVEKTLTVEGQRRMQYLYKALPNLLVSSSDASTSMWLIGKDSPLVTYANVVTTNAVLLIDKQRIALVNNLNMVRIWDSTTHQMVLEVHLSIEMKIHDVFATNEGKIGFCCTKGIYLLN